MMAYIDLHCDVLTCRLMREDVHLRSMPGGHMDLLRMKEGGCMAQCFAVYMPTSPRSTTLRDYGDYRSFFLAACKKYEEELKPNADLIAPALGKRDVEANNAKGLMSSILTLEDCIHLDGCIDRVDEMYGLGVRMASITWNTPNSLGTPNCVDMNAGLTDFGKDCIVRMNETGVIIDVSHLSDGGFWDIVKLTKKPFAASHSCCRALCDVSRDLTDDMLAALAGTNGVCGVNFASDFLVDPKERYTHVSDIVRHIDHMIKIGGEDLPALGSDFDGIGCTLEFGDCSGMHMVTDAIYDAFGGRVGDKVCFGNFLRVLEANCGC